MTEGCLSVRHDGGDRFSVSVRGHTIQVDQPLDAGGEDTAPSPTELFVASLASCVAFYARRYLRRHGLPEDGLAVTTGYELAMRPARVGSMWIEIELPDGVPAERREALLAVASHCTVHNTLFDPPDLQVRLADPGSAPPSRDS